MTKPVKTLLAFFKKKGTGESDVLGSTTTTGEFISPLPVDVIPTKRPRAESSELNGPKKKHCGEIDIKNLEHDPGLRPQMSNYQGDVKDEVRRAYLAMGPYQLKLKKYPKNDDPTPRSFVFDWFALFPNWLEYSPHSDVVFCLPCFLFHTPRGHKELAELNARFNENAMEILTLSASLVPKNGFKQFNVDQICRLVDKYYPADFNDQDKLILKFQLELFVIDARSDPRLSSLTTIPELCLALVETEKKSEYFLVDRLIRLILTLPVSTTTTERAFSTMKIVKTRLRNKMEDAFLADTLVMYIEKEIVKKIDTDSVIDDFKKMKSRRAKL